MCFSVDPAFPVVLVAQHNILCWKALEPGLVSPFLSFRYTFGKIVSRRIGRVRYESIGRGLHSCATQRRASNVWHEANAYPAIVPKGSLFWFNGGELVSNQLAVFATLDDALKACGQTKISRAVKLRRAAT